METAENIIITTLQGISMNRRFVRTCDPTAHRYDQQTLTDTHDLAPIRTNNDLNACGFLFYLEPVQIEFPDNTN